MVGVYRILNCVNGKFYIGSSINIEKRWNDHKYALANNTHNNKHLQNAWNKYGENNFKFEVLEETDINSLRERETFYLKSTNCTDDKIGYNMLDNAKFGLGVSASAEVRKKISESCKGEKNRHFGKHHTEQSKAVISNKVKLASAKKRAERLQKWIDEKHTCEFCGEIMVEKYGSGRFCNKSCCRKHTSKIMKGKPHSPEHNKKVSEALKGRKFSDEQKQKISENAKKRFADPKNNPMYGKKHSEATKKLISEKLKATDINSPRFTGHSHTEDSKLKISNSLKKAYKEGRR